jgi:hypothetical protein
MHSEERLAQLNTRWLKLMRTGRFEEAWLVSDEALRTQAGIDCRRWPRHLQFVWNGAPLAGRRVLVRCYHGFGDTIQYLRFVPLLRRLAADVIVWAQPYLIPLLRTMPQVHTVIPLHDAEPDVDYDVGIEITELPYALRITLGTLPAEVPYLHVDPAPRPSSNRLTVGLLWRSGTWDPRRSVPVGLLASLGGTPGVDWQIFQRGPALEEWPYRFGTVPPNSSLIDDARRLRALDLLISVDTFLAHLAGALAVPVWTLLHSDPDWRWMQERADSPWYPTMRLFRQARAGDWQPVIAEVEQALLTLVQIS